MSEQRKKKGFFSRNWFALSALVIGIGVGGFFYLRYAGLQNDYQASLEQREAELEQQFRQQRVAHDTEVLGLMAEAFTWAVRKSMLVGNMDEVGQYVFNLVQNEDVLEVSVLDDSQRIIVSSDQKLIDTQYATAGTPLSVSEPEVATQDSTYVVVTPITALTGHLGHTVIKYRITEL